ncbi:MAG: 4Fe-4S dicluster domain-containing protein [Ignavibacteriaceae bacterium]|jgi:molybdopterin-containing oxidoreductase family iron-sulfur binding subunit|nr:4Fe-4S dicluster domain-containing protein [Ignavibacteriaceae bacterium]
MDELKNMNNLKPESSQNDEFLKGVTDNFSIEEIPEGLSRRRFLALMGASAALVTVGCNDYHDKGEIVPYTKKPEEVEIGKPNYYASTCNGCSLACGILIKTREGRPIKIIGNPDHPVNKGKICSMGEANIMNLYDPARITGPLKKDRFGFTQISWDQAESEIIQKLKNAGGEIAVIAPPVVSPTVAKLFNEFESAFTGSKVYYHELFDDTNRKTAFHKCYGVTDPPVISFEDAKVIVTLEADIFGCDGHKIENMLGYSSGRNVENLNTFNRLYAVEGNMSLTGMNADYRMRLRPEAQYEFVMALLNGITKDYGSATALDAKANNLIASFTPESVAKKYSLKLKIVKSIISDLGKNKGKGIVFGGKTLPVHTHVAINLLNEVLGNTILYNKNNANLSQNAITTPDDLSELLRKMKNGIIKGIIHFDSNPVYQFPGSLAYADALKKVPLVVTMTEMTNETSALSGYILPIHHNFESWGDYQTRTGFYSLQQPVISPIYNTRQKEGLLLSWVSGEKYTEKLYLDYIKKQWQTVVFPKAIESLSFEKFWNLSLHDGIASVNDFTNRSFSITGTAINDLPVLPININGISVQLTGNYFLGDGRFSNNGWLQEMPHPVSKITWDNYAAISSNTAKKLGLENDHIVLIKTKDGKKIEIPVFIQTGLADDLLNIEIGYGRKDVAVVGLEVGFNPVPAMNHLARLSPYILEDVTISKTGSTHHLVSTQEHYNFNDNLTKDAHLKRHLFKEVTLEQYKKDPKFIQHNKVAHHLSMYEDHKYPNEKWAMAIDLNKCLGCAECVSACNVENNIPVVGRDQVQKGREMHWLRIDRYYSGTIDEPVPVFQPMMCQHCDHAPCENVCPVVATTHSNDGLNQMVYNRCVGTRYCSNNCPYKVRRFNFLNFRDNFADGYYLADSVSLAHNPEVTVRSRGVMEKCTFCIQRIMDVRTLATAEGKKIKDYELKTACMEACPANAIVFGDMNDTKSDVSKLIKHELGYKLLEELNVNPNITYIAKLKNIESEEV